MGPLMLREALKWITKILNLADLRISWVHPSVKCVTLTEQTNIDRLVKNKWRYLFMPVINFVIAIKIAFKHYLNTSRSKWSVMLLSDKMVPYFGYSMLTRAPFTCRVVWDEITYPFPNCNCTTDDSKRGPWSIYIKCRCYSIRCLYMLT